MGCSGSRNKRVLPQRGQNLGPARWVYVRSHESLLRFAGRPALLRRDCGLMQRGGVFQNDCGEPPCRRKSEVNMEVSLEQHTE